MDYKQQSNKLDSSEPSLFFHQTIRKIASRKAADFSYIAKIKI